MTKIKNTKKGMAKKTLSMSLVVAMLATSNVPVWAAEFSDGTDAAVTSEAEAPVVEDTADADTAAFTDEAAPEVATEETVAPATAAEVNTDGYVSTMKVNLNAKGWGKGNTVTVSGTLKDNKGNDVVTTWNEGDKTDGAMDTNRRIQVSYTWLSNGLEANGENPSNLLNKSSLVNTITYTPNKDDFNKDLSLMVTVKRGNTVVYQETVAGGVVGAQDISDKVFNSQIKFKDGATSTVYNGKEQKLTPENTYSENTEFGKIVTGNITWNYAQASNDFTNVTGKKNVIKVTGTLEGTYDATSTAYGYKAVTPDKYVGSYEITPLDITSSNLVASMKTTSVEFTGSKQYFGKSDVTMQVKVDDSTKIDITDAIDKDAKFEGDTAVGKYNLKVSSAVLNSDSSALKNFKLTSAFEVQTDNKYEIKARDLAKCSVESDIELNIDEVKGATAEGLVNAIKAQASDVTFKGQDGRTFALSALLKDTNKTSDDVTITAEQALVNAIKAGTTGTINGAVTVAYQADTKNVTGKVTVPVRLTVNNLANVSVYVNGTKDKDGKLTGGTPLSTSVSNPTDDLKLSYIAAAYDLEAGKYGISNVRVDGLKTGEYKLTYSDNVNAGTVKVTVTGLLSYAGSVKNFYFKINPATVEAESVSMKDKVTVNTANDADASLYKDALELAVKQELFSGNGKTTLGLDKDYTVKYYYTKENYNKDSKAQEITKTQATSIENTGDNVADGKNYVTAVVSVKKGNYNEIYFAKSAEITKKKISGVTISVEKPSYTYTGKQIVPEVVVKDGSSVLEKGVDYSLKLKDNVNVGTATVTVKALDGSDYETDSTATATFSITAAKAEDVRLVLDPATNSYNKGKQVKPKVTEVWLGDVDVTSQFDTVHVTYGDNNQAGKGMGTLTISPKTGNKNFTGTKTQKFDIKGVELKGALKVYGANKKQLKANNNHVINWDTYHFYYNGSECKFADEAFIPSNIAAAKEGTDYEIKYIRNVDAGFGFVAVVAKGNYEGNCTYSDDYTKDGIKYYKDWLDGGYQLVDGKLTLNGTVIQNNIVDIVAFDIRASVFTAKNITVSNGVYATGLPVTPKVNVTVAGKTLVEGVDYKLNIRPQDSDKGFTYPASVINATNGKVFYVDVVPMGGYEFDDVDGSNTFAWGIDKFDFAAADITASGDTVTVKNGNMVVDPSDYTVTRDKKAGTVTVAAKEGSQNYTGSQTVKTDNVSIQVPVISSVNVVGNKATVVLSGESNGASGYDYVISKANDYTSNRVAITKNQVKTTGDFNYVQQGTYYAYCHAWTRNAEGKKIFSGWSNIYPFSVSAITPAQPVITSVKAKGSTVTVTYTKADNADGYDVVLGTATKKVNGETRPVEYGKLVKKNIKGNVVTATFKNVKKGTYYAGLHAFNRTAENGKKVFSEWSNVKKVTVK